MQEKQQNNMRWNKAPIVLCPATLTHKIGTAITQNLMLDCVIAPNRNLNPNHLYLIHRVLTKWCWPHPLSGMQVGHFKPNPSHPHALYITTFLALRAPFVGWVWDDARKAAVPNALQTKSCKQNANTINDFSLRSTLFQFDPDDFW